MFLLSIRRDFSWYSHVRFPSVMDCQELSREFSLRNLSRVTDTSVPRNLSLMRSLWLDATIWKLVRTWSKRNSILKMETYAEKRITKRNTLHRGYIFNRGNNCVMACESHTNKIQSFFSFQYHCYSRHRFSSTPSTHESTSRPAIFRSNDLQDWAD